uniref:Uncharacterized protein n=1 Tax=Hippocampus comes TaxID=109280 RepID=A0A3Q2YUF6_HIPCM
MEKLCNQLMMRRFGREVDLEVLQTLSGNRTVEELKQEKLLQEAAYAKEIQQWDVRASLRVLRPACLCAFTSFDIHLSSIFVLGFFCAQCSRRADRNEILSLQELVRKQSQQLENLRREIILLSHQGADGLASSQTKLPPLAHFTNTTVQKHARKPGKANLNRRDRKAYD